MREHAGMMRPPYLKHPDAVLLGGVRGEVAEPVPLHLRLQVALSKRRDYAHMAAILPAHLPQTFDNVWVLHMQHRRHLCLSEASALRSLTLASSVALGIFTATNAERLCPFVLHLTTCSSVHAVSHEAHFVHRRQHKIVARRARQSSSALQCDDTTTLCCCGLCTLMHACDVSDPC